MEKTDDKPVNYKTKALSRFLWYLPFWLLSSATKDEPR